MFVGGMPEPVALFAANAPLDDIRTVQLDILRGYENDFSKYAKPTVSRRIADVWASMPR